MTLWLNHTIDERIAMLQRAEEKFRINQVAIENRADASKCVRLQKF